MESNDYNSWVIIQDMLEREGIARQHLNSYNEFVSKGIESIINEVGEVEIEAVGGPYKVKFGKIFIKQPSVVEIDGSSNNILPIEARLRNLTYASPVYLEMSIVEGNSVIESQIYHIGDLPTMVKSDLCPLHEMDRDELIQAGEDPEDPGGYFIINGSERVIVGLEDLSPNKILVDYEKSGGTIVYKAKVYSSIIGYRAKLELILKHDGAIYVKVPTSPVDLPFIIVMRALGIQSDKEIAEMVSLKKEIQDLLEVSFDKAGDVVTPEKALTYIGNRIAPGMLEEWRI
ncbi:MAG: DNA-directed RNA polymerase subunit B, partial [Nitrososphaerales archaeon]